MQLKLNLTQNNPPKVWVTSDNHWFHNNIIKFDKRGFENLGEMHYTLMTNWNNVVGKNDIVIYLGDLLCFAKREQKIEFQSILKRLNGTIHFVMGNHDDYNEIVKMGRFASVQDYLELRVKHLDNGEVVDTLFCCSHYAHYSWNQDFRGSIMLCGHSHGFLNNSEFFKNYRIFDVGCNNWDYTPVALSHLYELAQEKDFTNYNKTV